ncbi:C6 transcription factor [Penicillium verhagenii]|uniref:C6 transcription factor n=1 Tax=Penicillium verhagenii TaxID=1562060 RepID=UPI0025459D76|nr:C6 transcription factor [Penicillium verhagenii]KAJ5930880.1 C6 transcription factor [Penicillium verhagenii]
MATVAKGRRSHRKTRTGCLQCKQRKVKCDENKPGCQNCTRRDVACSFAEVPRPISSSHEQPTASPGSATPVALSLSPAHQSLDSQPTIPTNLQGFDIFDMQLLHHFMTTTCYTLSRAPVVQAVWRDEVPQIAFTMPGVLHAMLAVSALHLAWSDPSKATACIAQAHRHHNVAVQTVTPNIQSLASENSAGLFVFSSLTCIFACANAQSTFVGLFEHGHLAEWAHLFRGTRTVVDYSSQDFHFGPLGPMFTHGTNASINRRSPEALQQGQMYVWELKQLISRECLHDEKLQLVYDRSLEGLARTLAVAMKPGEGPRLQTGEVFAWLFEASNDYLDLLGQEKPIAIIIFGYFCVALCQIEWMWWIEGLSTRLMTQLHNVLNDEWQNWLKWPKEQIGWTLPNAK